MSGQDKKKVIKQKTRTRNSRRNIREKQKKEKGKKFVRSCILYTSVDNVLY